jgi:hypothetical protein
MQALIGPTPVLDVKKASKPGLTDVLKLCFEALFWSFFVPTRSYPG